MIGPLVVFTHIPKCGGTTVDNALRAALGGAPRHVRRGGMSDEELLSPAVRDRLVALSGHFLWDDPILERLGRDQLLFATVREPIAQLVSYYSYQRGKAETVPEGGPWRRFLDLSLDDFAATCLRKIRHSRRNVMCESFCRERRWEAALEVIERRYVLVVSVRAMDRLTGLLSRLLTGREPAVPTPRGRVSGSERLSLDPALRERLHDALAEDRALVAALESREDAMVARAEERMAGLAPLFRPG